MGIVTVPTTLVDGTIPTAAQFNGDFTTLYNEFNGNIDNSNIKSSAAITESKIAFDITNGHTHNGTDSKLIPKGYGFFASGAQSVANDVSWNPIVPSTQTATRLAIHVKTAPTGASLIAQVYNVTQAKAVASITLGAASTDGTTTSMTNASLAQNDVLRMDITQIGSTIAGSDVSLLLT